MGFFFTWAHTQRGTGAPRIQTLPNRPTSKSCIYSFLTVAFTFNTISSALTQQTATARKPDLGSVFSRHSSPATAPTSKQSTFPSHAPSNYRTEGARWMPGQERCVRSTTQAWHCQQEKARNPHTQEKVTFKVRPNQQFQATSPSTRLLTFAS